MGADRDPQLRIQTFELEDESVTNPKLADDAVDTEEIATDAVTAAEINTDAVGSSEIVADAVDTVHINTDAVTADQVAENAIGSSEVATDAISSDHLTEKGDGAGAAVDTANLATDAVGAVEVDLSEAYTWTGDHDYTGGSLTVPTPTSADEASTKSYVDSAINGLDWQDSVIDEQNAPPGAPSEGDRYLVGDSPSGDWTGHTNEIAEWDGSEWDFSGPDEGMATWIEDIDAEKVYNGSDWVTFGSTISHDALQNVSEDDHHSKDHDHTEGDISGVPVSGLAFDPATQTELDTHAGDESNPHSVTNSQTGAATALSNHESDVDAHHTEGLIKSIDQTVKTDTWSESVASGAESGDVTGLTVSTTPSDTGHDVLVEVDVDLSFSSQAGVAITLYRDGSPILQGDTAGNRSLVSTVRGTHNGAVQESTSVTFLDSPSTTSEVTYSIRVRHVGGGTETVYVNRGHDDSDNDQRFRSASTITAKEVA